MILHFYWNTIAIEDQTVTNFGNLKAAIERIESRAEALSESAQQLQQSLNEVVLRVDAISERVKCENTQPTSIVEMKERIPESEDNTVTRTSTQEIPNIEPSSSHITTVTVSPKEETPKKKRPKFIIKPPIFYTQEGDLELRGYDFWKAENGTEYVRVDNQGVIEYNPICKELKELFVTSDFRYKHFSKCAVVGGSPDLLKKEYGKEIDDYEAVFRVNNHSVDQSIQKFVGSKTTFQYGNVVNMKQFLRSNAGNSPEKHLYDSKYLFGSGSNVKYCLGIFYQPSVYDAFCSVIHKGGFKPDTRVLPVHHWWTHSYVVKPRIERNYKLYAQTGYSIIKLAQSLCQEVNVYGYSDGMSINLTSLVGFHYDTGSEAHEFLQKKAMKNYSDFCNNNKEFIVNCIRGVILSEEHKRWCEENGEKLTSQDFIWSCRAYVEIANFYLEYQEFKELHNQGLINLRT